MFTFNWFDNNSDICISPVKQQFRKVYVRSTHIASSIIRQIYKIMIAHQQSIFGTDDLKDEQHTGPAVLREIMYHNDR